MSLIATNPIDVNSFWDKTPKALKYFIVIALIIVGSYYLFSKSVSIAQIKQLDKIEESIATTYSLIDQFQEFEQSQYQYNVQTITYLKNIYTLVEELNDNTNKKLDIIIKSGGMNTNQILEKLTLLNESFDKLQKAYTPPEDKLKTPEAPPLNIKVTKINK